MSRVFWEVRIRSNIGEEEVKALFDTGASRTFILREVARRIGNLVELSRMGDRGGPRRGEGGDKRA